MVRFADIVQSKYRPEKPSKVTPLRTEEEDLRFRELHLLEETDERMSAHPFPEGGETSEVAIYYRKLLEHAGDVRARVKGGQRINPFPILAKIHAIANSHLVEPMYAYAMTCPKGDKDLPMHLIEVTFASMKVGKGMGYDTQQLVRLGLTAFLENVGIYRVPERILRKRERLNEEERKIIRAHPLLSARILARTGDRYQWLARLALQTHERSDGSGYPRGLEGEQISETASIIGLTETYIAMIKHRPYRDRVRQTDAVRFVIEEAKRQFPGKVLKAFINEVSLYPIHTHVRLNNKAIGRVEATHRYRPQRPTVALLYDSEGKRMKTPRTIDLSEDPLFYITEIIDAKDLPPK